MREVRRDNPHEIDADEIAALIAEGARVIVQFSKPGFPEQHLERLNELAQLHGRGLEIRFYGHYSDVFDASVLRRLPNVQCLSVDCLSRARGLEALAHLPKLAELRLGVFELRDPDVLAYCNVASLKSLVLGDTRNCNINLAHLAQCTQLEELGTAGHTRNISTLCALPSFRHLSLRSIKSKEDIGFVSNIPGLYSLDLVLGGRSSIAAITAPRLHRLEVTRVRGLEDLGDLGRFTHLEQLSVQDQIKLTTVRTGRNPRLKDIRLVNCKTLSQLAGIGDLSALTSLRISGTALDYEDLVQGPLPRSLKTFAFYTGKSKRNAEIRKDLDKRGFEEFTRQ